MSTANDRLLELIAKGDSLQALNLLQSGGADALLGVNRALYGPLSEANGARVRDQDRQHRAQVSAVQGEAQVTALYNLGCFALMQDDVLEARLRFTEVLEQEPQHLMARHNLAYAHELLAETDDARREYQAVLDQNPDCVLTRLNLAQLALQEGDYGSGLEDLEALHAADPANMGVLLYLCRGLLERGEPADLARVLQLLGQSAAAARYVDLQECRAYALFRQEDMEGAEAAFRQLLESDGDNLFALTGLIKVLVQRNELKALKPYVERCQALAPSDAMAGLLEDLAGG
jgi:tetratricopeptide (TPR) repeat protein